MSGTFTAELVASDWSPQKARHLVNRAGFGIPESAVQHLAALTPQEAVDLLVEYERFPSNLSAPVFLSAPIDREDLKIALETAEERERAVQELMRQGREEMAQLKVWWLSQMRATNRPLQEKLTLFWHSHFAVSAEKVKQPAHNYDLNKILRDNAAGNFRDLVFLVGKSPAMLLYLDNRQNRKGRPNENWARELMELFTLGIGQYSEQDIKEAARAFSGYTLVDNQFRFVPSQHDYGTKTFMGHTGDLDGRDIINIIFEQPAAAEFITRKLWIYFVYDNPSPELVREFAAILRENNYELKPLLRAIFLSREFYTSRAVNQQVKSPAQFLVMLLEHLQLGMPTPNAASLALKALGQDLFYPPNVKGWDGNRAWITTTTLLTRYNLPVYLATGQRPDLGTDRRLDEMGPPPASAPVMEPAMMEVNAQQGLPSSKAPAQPREQIRRQVQQRLAQIRASNAAARKTSSSEKRFSTRGNLKADVDKLFAALIGQPVSQAVEILLARYLSHPLDATQRQVLTRVLADGSNEQAPLTPQHLRKAGPAFLQLLFSTAEYQLC